ncbi:MAG: PAS domain-containing protein [Clostridium paraputrificum]
MKRETKGEAIIESIDSPLIVTDGSNKINMVNKSAERLLTLKKKIYLVDISP